MSSLNHTPNYGLTQYADNGKDKLEVMADYNHDMRTLDSKIKSLENRIAILEGKQNG